MKPEIVLKPEFVEFIPEQLEEQTLYVAAKFRTVMHLCACGCGRKVVTPLSPVSWKLTFDGVHVSLHPSIGNWSLPCQSHYWIERNRVQWAGKWSQSKIDAGRAAEERAQAEYYGEQAPKMERPPTPPLSTGESPAKVPPRDGHLRRLWRRLFG